MTSATKTTAPKMRAVPATNPRAMRTKLPKRNQAQMIMRSIKRIAASVRIICVVDQSGFRNAPAAARLIARSSEFYSPNTSSISCRVERLVFQLIDQIDHHRIRQVLRQIHPHSRSSIQDKNARVVADVNFIEFVRANHYHVMRNVRQLSFVSVFPSQAAVVRTKQMRVAEIRDRRIQKIRVVRMRFDARYRVARQN